MSWLIVLFLSVIVTLFLSFYCCGKDIMSPSVVLCSMFSLSIFFAILNIEKWHIDYGMESFFIMYTGIAIFFITEMVCYYFFYNNKVKKVTKYNIVRRKYILEIFLCGSIFICYYYLSYIKGIVGDSYDLGELFHAYRVIGIENMANNIENAMPMELNIALKITDAIGYISLYLLIYGIIFKRNNYMDNIKYVFCIVLSVLPSMMAAGRSGFLKISCAAVIMTYIIWNQRHDWSRCLSFKFIKYCIISIIIFSVLFYNSLSILGRGTQADFFQYISLYVGSSIYLFDLYVKCPTDTIMLGEESLYSLIKVLNYFDLTNASTSYNLEFRKVGEHYSNVYGFFRRPLHDFGLFGMYIFTSIISFVFNSIYLLIIKNKYSIFGVIIYGYLFYWLVVSSIVQYSITYISYGTLSLIVIMYIVFICFASSYSKEV